MGGWVGQWVNGWDQVKYLTKNLISLDLIEIIQFSLKIYDLQRHPHPHPLVGGWMGQWVNGWDQVK